MVLRRIGRAGVLAAAAAMILSGTTLADTVGADGDLLTTGVQTYVDLGTVAPGATISRDVTMTLFCAGLWHVDPGQVVTLSQFGVTAPSEGGSISATSTTVGPVPLAWADDAAGMTGCSGPMWVESPTPSHVTIVAPTVPGQGYTFTVQYGRSLSAAGVSDGSSITGFTSVSFVLSVADGDSTPPTFETALPDLDLVTSDPSGMPVSFAPPAATDDRDPTPSVACDPASGSQFPVGVTTVTCTASDAAGNRASETFDVDVHLASVFWEDPIHDGLTATRGRSLPVKVRAWLDGAALDGRASVIVSDCGSNQNPIEIPLTHQSDRWMTGLDTSMLGLGCHEVELVVNGLGMGSFNVDVVAPSRTTNAADRSSHRSS